MKVIVTGATGFIGRQVVTSLQRCGHEVIGVGRSQINLFDPVAVDDFVAAQKPKGLIHLAWDTTPGVYWETPQNLRWTAGSLLLFESFARHGGRRAVVAGTSAEYQWGDNADLDESKTPLVADSLYGVSKNALHQILAFWAQGVDVSLAWGRIFCTFGPHEKEGRLIPKLIAQLQRGKEFRFDSGSLVRDFLYVEDLGAAFAALFESEVKGAVNLASGEALSIREIVTFLSESLRQSEKVRFDVLPDPVGQASRVVASINRLTTEVGWTPEISTRDRLGQTCSWWIDEMNK
ncbi:NAD-dependent epimerase/dehydratase family protein [Synoicihabitans lomoniglobus]|uniref:NAD(P)-dependent oxidoreductase n=1 Tax=Synoicihabitans lomoniglobus TaxID=2909285 RepID=A0AAF0CQY5_9BACT|nr:NAD(P)-dependent oxidoreductase [Opitutaceae bacterium LMO-M01]WED66351.1 NAD(P)-dependent oxidoreductase [Opitutaceae bacterium LMO-M01]